MSAWDLAADVSPTRRRVPLSPEAAAMLEQLPLGQVVEYRVRDAYQGRHRDDSTPGRLLHYVREQFDRAGVRYLGRHRGPRLRFR